MTDISPNLRIINQADEVLYSHRVVCVFVEGKLSVLPEEFSFIMPKTSSITTQLSMQIQLVPAVWNTIQTAELNWAAPGDKIIYELTTPLPLPADLSEFQA